MLQKKAGLLCHIYLTASSRYALTARINHTKNWSLNRSEYIARREMKPSRIIGYTSKTLRDGRVLLEESIKDQFECSRQLDELFLFLLKDYNEADSTYFKATWDLKEFTQPLLDLMPYDEQRQLLGDKHRTNHGPFKLYYIPHKIFSITYRWNIRANIYDTIEQNIYEMKQFYPEEDLDNPVEIADYGNNLLDNLKRIGIVPTRVTSPVAIYQDGVLDNINIATIYNLPDYENNKGVAEYSMQIMDREWRTTYKDYQGPTYTYDIRAAYPSIAISLPDTSKCDYIYSKEWQKAHWGVVRGEVTNNSLHSPIVWWNGEEYINKVGTWTDYFSTEIIQFIEKHNLGSFKMYDGWFLNPKTNSKPIEVPLMRLFSYREINEDIKRWSKAMSVGVYGKFCEEHDDGSYGKFFNPIYAAMITSRCRLKVADFIFGRKLQDSLISIVVDGVKLDKKITVPSTSGMGQWIEKEGE